MSSAIVLDNVVLSGFYTAGWFDNLAFWKPDYEILVSEVVWKNEFHQYDDPPSWIDLVKFEKQLESEVPGALGFEDWSCIAVAEQHSATLVTRDRDLKRTAEERGVSTMWTGRFVIDTYEECGIGKDEFQEGLEDYLQGAYLSDSVAETIRDAEKP